MTETYETIVEALENAGYDVYTEVISSRGLTATVRKRLYFVGLRRDDFTVDESGTSPGRHEQRNQFEFPFIPDLQIRARDVLDFDEMSEEELEILRLADDTLEQLLSSRRWRPHSLAWPNKSIDTVTSHYGNAVGRGETQLVPCSAPHSPRRFSIRECARVMGFPNSYEFLPPGERQSPMAYRKMHYRMCGNAVCPPVIAALAGSVLDCCRITCSREEGWVQHGRSVAIVLALEATRKSPATLPRGCLVLGEY
jgi:site-specific DNA-cytosine methylase